MTASSRVAGGTRLRLDIAYEGTGFAGWAQQPARRTVQGELEHWIGTVLRLSSPPALTCAGRTDAGVHARGQVAHLDLDQGQIRPFARVTKSVDDLPALLHQRLARALPSDLVVTGVSWAPAGFDARFSALWRQYVYRLWDRGRCPEPTLRHRLATVPPIEVALLNQVATGLTGLRDFAPFCRRRPGATTIRTLLALSAVRRSHGELPGLVELTVRADAFCHSMVRSLTGALVEVASGRRDPAWLIDVAGRHVRAGEVPVMPAAGLTLAEVRYPADDELAERAALSREVRVL